MSAYKHRNNYYIKGYFKDDDGSIKYYNKVAKNCTGIKEAREYERLFRLQWQDIKVSFSMITFRELSEQYLNDLPNVKKVTITTHSTVINKINHYIGNKKINIINKTMIQNMITDLEANLSHVYVSKILTLTKTIFNYAVINEMLQVNPAINVRLSSVKDKIRKQADFWEPSEFEVFISHVDDAQFRALFTFLYYMGARKGEALALQWKDIDFSSSIVSIYKTVNFKEKGVPFEITSPKTENSYRNIPMFKVVSDELMNWYNKCSKVYGFNDEYYLFGIYRPMPPENLRRKIRNTINEINEDLDNKNKLKLIKIHDFRHSHASWLISNMAKYNFSDFDIAKRLGHTVEMLHSTYAHQFKNSGMNIINNIESGDEFKKGIIGADKDKITNKYDELIELKKLLDIGIITDDEFNLKKKAVLGI